MYSKILNAIMLNMKNKSFFRTTRFRVYFLLFIVVIFIPGLLTYNMRTSDGIAENESLIPSDHQLKRFEYLTASDFETKIIESKVYISFNIQNNSYIYDLKNINFTINYFSDEENTKLITSETKSIEELTSQSSLLVQHEVSPDLPQKFWWTVTPEKVELQSKK